MQYHPDFGGDGEIFVEINKEYNNVLVRDFIYDYEVNEKLIGIIQLYEGGFIDVGKFEEAYGNIPNLAKKDFEIIGKTLEIDDKIIETLYGFKQIKSNV